MATLNLNTRTALGEFRAAGMLKITVFVTGAGFNGLYVDGRLAENKPWVPLVDDADDFYRRGIVNGYEISDGSVNPYTMKAGTSMVFYLSVQNYSSIAIYATGAATSSATVTVTGQSAPTIDLEQQTSIGGPVGAESLRVLNVPNAVNRVEIAGSTTGQPVRMYAAGADTNINYRIDAKGTGNIALWTRGAPQVVVPGVDGAVNYARLEGGSTGNAVVYSVDGADTDAGVVVRSKGNSNLILSSPGTGSVALYGAGGIQFAANGQAGVVNHIQVHGGLAGGFSPYLNAVGSDANIGLAYQSKGAGGHSFYTYGVRQAEIFGPQNAVNVIAMSGNVAGSNPYVGVFGPANDVGLDLTPKGAGELNVRNGNGTAVAMSTVPGAVNYVRLRGSASGQAILLGAEGVSTDVGIDLVPKGLGVLVVRNTQGAILQGDNVAGTVNFAQISGSAAGQPVRYRAAGGDANIPLYVQSKGTSEVVLASGGSFVLVAAAASGSVNYAVLRGSVTGAAVGLESAGADANIPLSMVSKGTGRLAMVQGGIERFAVSAVGDLVATGQVIASSTGHLSLRSYTVATLPAGIAGQMIYVSNGTANKRLAVYDGTSWRFPDGAVVS